MPVSKHNIHYPAQIGLANRLAWEGETRRGEALVIPHLDGAVKGCPLQGFHPLTGAAHLLDGLFQLLHGQLEVADEVCHAR